MNILFCLLCLLSMDGMVFAQDPTPATAPVQTPGAPTDTPAPAAQTPGTPAQEPTPPPAPSRTLSAPREVPSPVNNGNGFSIEPLYWLTVSHPQLRQGKTDTQVDPGNFTYTSSARRALGARVNVPIGNGTLRISYSQAKSSGSSVAPANLNLYGVEVTKNDPILSDYTFTDWKVSYDYLTYFWRRSTSEVRLKTLWEFQRLSFANSLLDFTPVGDGTFQPNQITGTTTLALPTFGLGLEQTLSRHLRWEVKGSGFGLPHHPDIVDGEALIALRYTHFEIGAGGRYLHWKTSVSKDHYNIGSIYGPFVSVRYYWKRQ